MRVADVLESAVMSLRPLRREDFSLIVGWINQPHVARWWDGPATIESIAEKFEPRLQEDSPTRVFVIEVEERPVGFIQLYRHRDYPEWDRDVGVKAAAGIDYLIGEPDATKKGIGTQAICAVTEAAFETFPDIEIVIAVPQKENLHSWHALENAGYQRLDERKLASRCPSDAGISYIYGRRRPSH